MHFKFTPHLKVFIEFTLVLLCTWTARTLALSSAAQNNETLLYILYLPVSTYLKPHGPRESDAQLFTYSFLGFNSALSNNVAKRQLKKSRKIMVCGLFLAF